MKIPGKKPWPFARGNSSWEGVGVIFRKELADHLNSRRFNILALLVLVTGIASIYAASKGISQAGEDVDFVFLRLFTSGGDSLPSFVSFVAFLGPLVGLALSFDGINGKGPGDPEPAVGAASHPGCGDQRQIPGRAGGPGLMIFSLGFLVAGLG